ncbi:Kalirin [Orbilia brochopaga]|nr:Kalirin [Drechslerella brochopaga]
MTIELDHSLLMKTHAAVPAASPRISSTISTASSQTLVNPHASISTISSISTTATLVNGNSGHAHHNGSPVVASPAFTLGPSIPTATDSLINKQADASQSLYQICMNLKKRLELIPEVKKHLDEFAADPEDPDLPADPVYQVWQTFRNGASLALLSRMLVTGAPVKDATEVPDSLNKKKKLVFQFLKEGNEKLKLSGDDTFIISHLYGEDTNGFVKVARVVSACLDELENRGIVATNEKLAERKTDMASLDKRGKSVAEFLETERKYVQDLQALQDYMHALQTAEIVSNDTIHSLFLNLNHLLDFQRRFLIRLEMMYDMPPEKQKWGSLFQHYESAFGVYEDFCANFKHAQDLAVSEAPRLNKLDHPLNKAGVGGFLIKPPQRICRYTLLLESILKASAQDDPRREDLEEGLRTVVRINTKVNEAVGKLENAEVVVELKERVEDWKGHQIDHFGDLLLFGQFTVIKGDAKGDIEREYHIYLFERILLCCKEIGANKKPKPGVPANRKKGKLQLKGRIFMQNVTDIISLAKNGSYTLQIFWKGDPGVENFIIRQRNEELLKQWNGFLHRQVALWKRDDIQVKSDRPVRFPTSNTEFYWTVGTNVPQPADDPDTSEDDEEEEEEQQPPDADALQSARVDASAKYAPGGAQAGFPPPKQPKYPVSSSSAYLLQSQNTTPVSTTTPNGMSYFSPGESPMPTPSSRQTSGHTMHQDYIPRNGTPPSDVMKLGSDPAAALRQMPVPSLKVKVSYITDMFVIIVPQNIGYTQLMDRIERKVRLCGGATYSSHNPLRVRYQDEDGDYITVNSDEDVQMAIESRFHGGDDSVNAGAWGSHVLSI